MCGHIVNKKKAAPRFSTEMMPRYCPCGEPNHAGSTVIDGPLGRGRTWIWIGSSEITVGLPNGRSGCESICCQKLSTIEFCSTPKSVIRKHGGAAFCPTTGMMPRCCTCRKLHHAGVKSRRRPVGPRNSFDLDRFVRNYRRFATRKVLMRNHTHATAQHN